MRIRTILCLTLLLFLIGGLLIPPLFNIASAQKKVDPNQDQPRISESAARQIQSLIEEKKARSPEQKKIESQLIYAAKQRSGVQITTEVQTLQTDVEVDEKGGVLVDIKANVTKELLEQIAGVGGTVVHASPRYNVIRARVSLGSLEEIARSNDVKFIRSAVRAVTHRNAAPKDTSNDAPAPRKANSWPAPGPQASFAERGARVRAQLVNAFAPAGGAVSPQGPIGPITNVGAVTSQGDIAHRAQQARNVFGVNGAGIKIGVLSDSVRFLERSQATGDLPPDVTVLPGQSGVDPTPPFQDIGEGTAMLEIVYDLAPGAKLFFATAFNGDASFAENIRSLRFDYGCDIIVDDVFYFNESPFQDGIIAQAVNDVTAAGGLYFSSAGNEGNFNDGTSGVWEGDYVSSTNVPPALTADYNDVLDFGDGNISNRLEASAPFAVSLFWSDPLGGSSNDYDIFALNNTLTAVVQASVDPQDGDDDPFEIFGPVTANNRIVIARFGDAAVRALHLNTIRGQLGVATDGQTKGHSAARDAFSVAAVNVAVTGGGPFTGGLNNPVELFEADGPRRIFYNADGTPITPDNLLFSTGGGEVRQKPDIAAADGVATTFPPNSGLNPFFGTSAAAPHAAAIAGLVKSADLALSPAEIRRVLTSTALDIEAVGVDRDSGVGIVMAFEALEFIGAQAVPFLERGAVTATPAGGDDDPFIEPGEGGSLAVQLVNNGGIAATSVSATLTTSTPGVTITQDTSAYPDIAPAGSAVNNTPFTFSLADDVPCGLAVNFTLTVTYSGNNSPQVFTFTVQTGSDAIANGGFETGTFTGWITPVIPGSNGSFLVRTGTTLPLSGLPTVGPRTGTFYAVNDMTGPGTHALIQTITVPASSSSPVILSFDMFANNFTSNTIVNPIGLDHRVGLNQHARVDILSAGASPFDTGAGVLRNFYLGADPGPNPHPYTHYEFDITELVAASGTFQLRFAVTNNLSNFNLGVDNVSITSGCNASLPTGTGLRGEYYNNIDFTDLVLTRIDPTIDFDFGTGSPDPAIDPETFSVRWSGQVQPEYSEDYTFYTVSDDGVRLTVNGQVLIDNRTIHPATEDSGTITLEGGQRYDIQLEYYENTIDAVARLLWSSASQPKQIIPQNRLFAAN